ncbi:MAG: SNF2-related protein [Parachlamydiaceae bacterium]
MFAILQLHEFASLSVEKLNPYALFDSLPIDGLEAHPDRNGAMGFLEQWMDNQLIPIAKDYVKKQLDSVRTARFEKLHQFILECPPHRKTFFSFAVIRYLYVLPKSLITVDTGEGEKPKLQGLDKSLTKARKQKQPYRTTVVHWMSTPQKNRSNSYPYNLRGLLDAHPDALDWPDSNGDSVKDLMKVDSRLQNYINNRVLLNSSETPVSDVWPLKPTPQQHLNISLKSMIRDISTALDHNADALSDHLIRLNGAVEIAYQMRWGIGGNDAKNAYERVAEAVLTKRALNEEQWFKHRAICFEIFGKNLDATRELSFVETPLSDRQMNEVLGAVYHFIRLEFAKMKQLTTWQGLDAEIRSSLPGSEVRKLPLLVIRQENDRVHAEIVTGHFTMGNHLVGVTQDSTNEMTQKIKSMVDVESTFERNEEGDRMVKLTVEGMDRLLAYIKEEKGLNLVILPRIGVPETKESEVVVRREVSPRAAQQESEAQHREHEVRKRALEAAPMPPKRLKLDGEPEDPEILPDAFEPSQKGVASLQQLTVGIVERDLVEMPASGNGKRSTKELSPENLYIPGAAAKKQKQMIPSLVDLDDPASYFKNMAFELIQKTIEEVKSAGGIQKFLDDEVVDFPIIEKLRNLPPKPKPFIFSNLFPYQKEGVKSYLRLRSTNIFPLISYSMGLGKTYIYVELLMQQLAANPQGTHLVVVPKSVVSQALEDIQKGLANAKATCWRTLWKRHPEIAHELLRQVLNSQDISSLLPLLPSLDLLRDGHQLSYFLTKTRDLVIESFSDDPVLYRHLTQLHEIKDQLGLKRDLARLLVKQIAQESAKTFVVVEQMTPIDSEQLSGLILFNENNIVEVENAGKKKQDSPFKQGRIVVTRYHQIGALSECAGANQLASITCDEAQNINGESTIHHQQVKKLFEMQKERNFARVLLTGTPLENSLEEPEALLRLANPELFPASTFNSLRKFYALVDHQVSNIGKPGSFDVETAVKVFVQHSRLKEVQRETVITLTQERERTLYGAQFPVPTVIVTRFPFNDIERQKVDIVSLDFAQKNQLGMFGFVTQINKILTHPLFDDQNLSIKSPAFLDLTSRIERGEADAVIQESSILRTLFDSQGFREIFVEKKKGILIVDNIAPGELIRRAAGPFSKFYEGSLDIKDRQKIVDWFNEEPEEPEPRLLILSIEAGGVGLNLPKADLVISATRTYNPGQEDQAIARAFRFGYEGEKPVYRLIYENSLFSLHLETIHKIKRLWVETLFKPKESYKKEFALFMRTRVAEAGKLLLNFNKETENFPSDMEAIQNQVDALSVGVTEELLKRRIEGENEFERIPIPYGLSREDVEWFTYAYQVRSDDHRLNALKQNAFNSWFVRKTVPKKLRNPEVNGFPNYRNHIQAVINRMKVMDFELPKSLSFTKRDTQKLQSKDWPDSVLLYQKKGTGNQLHFDALISKATATKLESRIPKAT